VGILRYLSVQPTVTAARSLRRGGCAAAWGSGQGAGQIAGAIGDPNPLHTEASPVGGVLPGLVVLARALRVHRAAFVQPAPVRCVDARFTRPVYAGQDIEVRTVGDSEFKVLVEGVTVIRSVRLTVDGRPRAVVAR
jgi:acyl dehydratase